MSEQREAEIARRLRETGIVEAPETLRPAVMRRLRRPLRERLPLRGLGAAVAASAAVALAALALTHLSGGVGSSASGGSSAAAGAEATHKAAQSKALPQSALGTAGSGVVVGRRQAQAILAPYLSRGFSPLRSDRRIVVRVPAGRLEQLRHRLQHARRTSAGPTVRVVLRAAGGG